MLRPKELAKIISEHIALAMNVDHVYVTYAQDDDGFYLRVPNTYYSHLDDKWEHHNDSQPKRD